MDFEHSLNKNQLLAVSAPYKNIRVIAGAGSGKTRVLTYRIAYLISECNVKPWNILAITFTNKVAAEMKERVEKLLPSVKNALTIKTFHSFAAMFLRIEIGVLNFPTNFTILDEEDQTKLIKDICAEKGYRRTDPIVAKAKSYIGSNKLKEKYPDDIKIQFEKFEGEKECLEIYAQYEEMKDRQFALDFDDLLLKTNIILENFPLIKAKWQNKISHILVDEFQDTNDVEYRLIRHLYKDDSYLYVVGDPDQTIYTWRGANQNIILNIDKHFGGFETIVLDQNYRSTQAILDSANKLISHNKFRVPKDLFTDNLKGDPLTVKGFTSGISEAEYVAREINLLKTLNHYSLKDIVILYRSSYITRDFEKAFTAHHIPYVIYGGIKFYERKEIKDVLSYFRLMNNSRDDIAFERIMNVPKRNIGQTTVDKIKAEAFSNNMSLVEYINSELSNDSEAPKKAINSLRALLFSLYSTKDNIDKDEEVMSKLLEEFIVSIGYYDYLLQEDDGDERIENVKSLFEDIRHYLSENPECTLDEYLQNIALISAQDEVKGNDDHVTLMTVHTAKGLEYPVVFVARFNDGVFPHQRSVAEGYQGLEEERRLAYVAMTRAMKKLYLTFSEDYSYVAGGMLKPSSFIKESGNIIKEYEQHSIYGGGKTYQTRKETFFDDEPYYNSNKKSFNIDEPIKQNFSQLTNNETNSWNVGDICIHQKFGKGVVTALEGDGIITVDFESAGIKSIMGNHKFVSKGSK